VRCIGDAGALEAAEAVMAAKLPTQIAGEGGAPLEDLVVNSLIAHGKTLAVAESCTGGYLANKITNVPGASEVFLAGYITYSNEAKTRALGVPAELIAEHGAVSAPVAQAMAEGASRESGASFALATTGVAGPGGGTPEKPVGTVFIALAMRGEKTQVAQHAYPTDRETFKSLTTQTALDMLRKALIRAD
jgi:nicotinamide-nucleotide amidase